MDLLTSFRCDIYTAVSEAAARFQEKMCHFPKGRILVLPNGSDAVHPAAASLLEEKKKEALKHIEKTLNARNRGLITIDEAIRNILDCFDL